jgi:hypothetical protein
MTPSNYPRSQFRTEHEAARILKISVSTLRRRRKLKQLPVFHRIGFLIRYSVADLEAFAESCRVNASEQQKSPLAAASLNLDSNRCEGVKNSDGTNSPQPDGMRNAKKNSRPRMTSTNPPRPNPATGGHG